MKISKLFHWLYFILMMLPLFGVASTFAYYSFNKNASVPTVTDTVSREVDFNQINNYQLVGNAEWTNKNVIGSIVSNEVHFSSDGVSTNSYLPICSFTFIEGHQYLLRTKGFNNPNGCRFYILESGLSLLNEDEKLFIPGQNHINPVFCRLYIFGDYLNVSFDFNCYVNLFDLTQMFGVGNEPTIQQFNTWFPNDFYDYTTSEHIVIENYSTQEVSDSAINHFWLPSFGGASYVIKNVYNFLVGSLFGFSIASGVGYVVVELLTYWTAVSIIYLVFDLFMYLPLLVHRWVDKARLE